MVNVLLDGCACGSGAALLIIAIVGASAIWRGGLEPLPLTFENQGSNRFSALPISRESKIEMHSVSNDSRSVLAALSSIPANHSLTPPPQLLPATDYATMSRNHCSPLDAAR